MGLLYRDEPVTDSTVNCPECRAIDWVVRTPRLGGQAKIVCRACGYVDGPYFEFTLSSEHRVPEPPDVAFPCYVPKGLEWEYGDAWEHAVTVVVEDPWVAVTTEDEPTEVAEALRDAVADVLGPADPPAGRSQAASLLEFSRENERIEAIVSDLHIENGTLHVDGADVPAKLMRTGDAWAAHAMVGGIAVIASSADVPLDRVALVRR